MTLFLQRIEHRLEENCFLLTLRPIKLSGRKTKKEFIKWKPPKRYVQYNEPITSLVQSFKAQMIHIQTTPETLPWPPESVEKVKGQTVKLDPSYEEYDLESPPVQQKPSTSKDSTQTLKLTCGSHVMLTKFEIATYIYKPNEETEEIESTAQSEETKASSDVEQKVSKTTNEEQEQKMLLTAEIHQ